MLCPRALAAAGLALLAGCTAITSSERFEPHPLDAGAFAFEAGGTVARPHTHRWRLAGADATARLEADGFALELSLSERTTTPWCCGIVVPILPLFFLDGDPETTPLVLTVQGVELPDQADGTPHELELRAVALRVVEGSSAAHPPGATLAPARWTASNSASFEPVDWAPGSAVPLDAESARSLTFDATMGDVDAFELELELASPTAGWSRPVRLGFSKRGATLLWLVPL